MAFRRVVPPFIFFILFVSSVSLAATEIYRWTDENGKVHFSDGVNKRPQDQSGQKKVEVDKIEVKPTNSADKPDSFGNIYQSVDQEKQRESEQNQAQRERQQQVAAHHKKCAAMKAFIDHIGPKGTRITYLTDENGKALTNREQEAELEKMRREMQKAGCL